MKNEPTNVEPHLRDWMIYKLIWHMRQNMDVMQGKDDEKGKNIRMPQMQKVVQVCLCLTMKTQRNIM